MYIQIRLRERATGLLLLLLLSHADSLSAGAGMMTSLCFRLCLALWRMEVNYVVCTKELRQCGSLINSHKDEPQVSFQRRRSHGEDPCTVCNAADNIAVTYELIIHSVCSFTVCLHFCPARVITFSVRTPQLTPRLISFIPTLRVHLFEYSTCVGII